MLIKLFQMPHRAPAWLGVFAVVITGLVVMRGSDRPIHAQEAKPAIAWEYEVAYIQQGVEKQTLNAMGSKGWELVAVRPYETEQHRDTQYLFKRQKP